MSKDDDVLGSASALRAAVEPQGPREQLRDLIAEKLYEVSGRSPYAADWLRRHHAGHLAEGLMELFPEVGAEEAAGWWFEKDEPQRIFVLRTAPTAAKRLAEGDKSNGSEVS